MHPALVVGRLHQSQRYCGGILGRSWRRSWSLRATAPSSEPLLVGRSGGASSSCLFLLSTRPRCVGRPPSLVRSSLVRWLSSSSSSSAPASSLASPSAGGARKPLPKGVEPRQQQQLSIRDVNDRAMTASERIKIFPTAVMDIWREYQLYNAINAAAATKQNGWHGVVPRHQREQQRHFIESIGVVGPLILVWIPPIMYVTDVRRRLCMFWYSYTRFVFVVFFSMNLTTTPSKHAKTSIYVTATTTEATYPCFWPLPHRDKC